MRYTFETDTSIGYFLTFYNKKKIEKIRLNSEPAPCVIPGMCETDKEEVYLVNF